MDEYTDEIQIPVHILRRRKERKKFDWSIPRILFSIEQILTEFGGFYSFSKYYLFVKNTDALSLYRRSRTLRKSPQ